MMDNTTNVTMLTEEELRDLFVTFTEEDYKVDVKDKLTEAKEWLQSMGNILQKQLLIECTTFEDVPQYRTEYDVEVEMYYDGDYHGTTWKTEQELTDIIRSSAPWDYYRTGNTKEHKVYTGIKRISHTITRPMTDEEIIATYNEEIDWLRDFIDFNFDVDNETPII